MKTCFTFRRMINVKCCIARSMSDSKILLSRELQGNYLHLHEIYKIYKSSINCYPRGCIKLKYECIVSIHFYFICNEYMVQEDRIGILFLSTFKSTYRTRLNPIAGEGHALPCHILSIYFLQQTPIFAQNNPIIHSSFSLPSILFSNPSVRIRTCTYIYFFPRFFPFAIFNSSFQLLAPRPNVNYYRIVASDRRILSTGKRNCYLY